MSNLREGFWRSPRAQRLRESSPRCIEQDRHARILKDLDGLHPPPGTYMNSIEAERYMGVTPPQRQALIARGLLTQWRLPGSHPNRLWYRRAECESARLALATERRTQRDRQVPKQVERIALAVSDEWLTLPDAAAYLRCSVQALTALTLAGRFTTTVIEDRHRWRRADLDEFLTHRDGGRV